MRSPVNHALPLVLIAGILGSAGAYAKNRAPTLPASGPAADYPVVLGEPLQIGGTTYTPEDRLNYDAVGYADVGTAGGAGVSAAHKTLPLPSYAEVTSLESGRTILVRVERRGPMNDKLIELSPGAAAQLGLAGSARPAVRVRRVNPPEQERAMLRTGGQAAERMATPKGLLDALNRKLNAGAAALSPKPEAQLVSASAVRGAAPLQPPPRPAPQPALQLALAPKPIASPAPQPGPAPKPQPQPIPAAKPTPAAAPVAAPVAAPAPRPAPTPAAQGALAVQVAAFSTQDRAAAVAGKLGGRVGAAGKFWRVRLGPFTTRAEAEAALAKAKGAGYSDARIQRAD